MGVAVRDGVGVDVGRVGLAEARPLAEEGRESRGGLRHEHPVHAVAAGPELSPQPRGPEGQARAEAVGEVGCGIRVSVVGRREELLELGAGLGVGILREPGAGGRDSALGGAHSASITRASSDEITGSASRPASMTS